MRRSPAQLDQEAAKLPRNALRDPAKGDSKTPESDSDKPANAAANREEKTGEELPANDANTRE